MHHKKYKLVIQRIQSVYLALTAICMAALYFTSIATFGLANKTFIYSIFSLNEQGNPNLNLGTFPTFLLGLTTTIVTLSFYCVSAFNNRMNQLKFVRLNTLFLLVFVALYVFAFNKSYDVILNANTAFKKEDILTNYLFGSITPILALVFNVLAFRAIKKDEALVRSADRIR